MSRTPTQKDRFDDLPSDGGRIGAHRAENPRMRGGVVVLWSIIAIVVLVAAGIFGTLVVTGRVTLFPSPSATPVPIATAEPVVDTSYKVSVLNASAQSGLAGAFAQKIIAAGWPSNDVTAGDAGSSFQTTTVFYTDPAEEGAARGLAQTIGGAAVSLSDAYKSLVDAAGGKLLVVVIGADRADAGATPAG